MNNIYGITYKMGAYINSAIKSNEPICLYTAEDDTASLSVPRPFPRTLATVT